MINKQAIVVKNILDKVRAQHENVKYIFYSIDNSEGAKLLMEGTRNQGFYRARFMNPDAGALRNTRFGNK